MRWFVVKDGNKIGPFDADEIRQRLRDGDFDPFDLVSKEGSEISVPLVEIDEIFTVQQAQFGDSAQEHDMETTKVSGAADAKDFGESSAEKTSKSKNKKSKPRPDGAHARSSRKTGGKNRAKKFYLINSKGRVLGPMSAREVQERYYRGRLSPNVKVRRSGSKKLVPVADFVAVYSASKSGGTKVGDQPMGFATNTSAIHLPNAANLEAKTRAAKFDSHMGSPGSNWLAIGAGIVTAIGIFLGLLAVYQDQPMSPSSAQTQQVSQSRAKSKNAHTGSVKKKITKKRVVKNTRRRSKARTRKKVQPRAPRKVVKTKYSAPKKSYRQKVRYNPKKSKPAARKKYRPKKKVYKKKTYRTRALAAKTAPSKKKARPKKSAGKIAMLEKRVGQTATVGPLFYSKAQLSACAAKCNLTLRDGSGKSVTAIFFKPAFEADLKSRPGRATVTGQVAGSPGSLLIIVSDVR